MKSATATSLQVASFNWKLGPNLGVSCKPSFLSFSGSGKFLNIQFLPTLPSAHLQDDLRLVRNSASVHFIASPGELVPGQSILTTLRSLREPSPALGLPSCQHTTSSACPRSRRPSGTRLRQEHDHRFASDSGLTTFDRDVSPDGPSPPYDSLATYLSAPRNYTAAPCPAPTPHCGTTPSPRRSTPSLSSGPSGLSTATTSPRTRAFPHRSRTIAGNAP